MNKRPSRIDWNQFAPWIYTAILFIVWELAVRIFAIPQFILPAPTRILEAIIQYWPAIWKNSLQTLYTTTVGFILAVGFGLALGIAIGWSRFIYAGLYPLMIGFNAIPKVAVVPILVIWFGIGTIQYQATHTRPVWNSGNIRAQMTANSVIASAERLIDVRHFCRKR